MKPEDFKWYNVSDILPENCDYEKTKSYVNKDFIVYLSNEYDPCYATRAYENPGRGWYWEFGIYNFLGDDDTDHNSNMVTKWMPISLPDDNA